jgi:hypothetical protein
MQPSDSNMLDLAVQPPEYAQTGSTLFPPVAARLRSNINRYDELSQMWALATLVDLDGQVVSEQLSGRTADSAHPMIHSNHGHGSNDRSVGRDQAYFYFPDLAIHTPGRYRIRVTLMRMDYSYGLSDGEGVAVAEDYIDSRSIAIEDGNVGRTRPSGFLLEVTPPARANI